MIQMYEVILNPAAGKGKARGEIPAIRSFLERSALTYRLHLTEKPGDAASIAASLEYNRDTAVIAAGGDGTCNEVVNGLLSRPPSGEGQKADVPLFGVLPIGRGNDFSYGAGLPSSLPDALELLLQPKVSFIDAGYLRGGDFPDGRYFVNGVGVGFDAIVGFAAAKMRMFHGAAGYLIAAVRTLIAYPEPPRLEIVFNGSAVERQPALVSIMNGRRMGGSFYMAPTALINDGLLDICMTDHGPRGRLLRSMYHYSRGTQASLPNTVTAETEGITLKALAGGMAVHADGETICTSGTNLEISCRRSVLLLLGGKGEPV